MHDKNCNCGRTDASKTNEEIRVDAADVLVKKLSAILPLEGGGEEHTLINLLEAACVSDFMN